MQPLTLCEKQNRTLRAFSFFLPRHCLLERSTGHETVLRAGVCFVLTRKAVRTRAHLAAGRVANRILRVVVRAAFRQGHVPIDAGSLPSERRPHYGGNVSLHFLALLMRGLANGVQRAEATSWAGARTWRAGPSGSVSALHGLRRLLCIWNSLAAVEDEHPEADGKPGRGAAVLIRPETERDRIRDGRRGRRMTAAVQTSLCVRHGPRSSVSTHRETAEAAVASPRAGPHSPRGR